MGRPSIGGERRHVIFSKQQNEKLLRLSRDTGLTPSEHIRRAVDLYFKILASERKTA